LTWRPRSDPCTRHPCAYELEVAERGFDEGEPLAVSFFEEGPLGIYPSLGEETVKIDDQLLHLMQRLRTSWQFDVIKAWRFAYRGE